MWFVDYHIALKFRRSKIPESLQISIKVNFRDHFKFSWFNVVPPIFQWARYIGHLMTSNFVTKIFVILVIYEIHENIMPQKFEATRYCT